MMPSIPTLMVMAILGWMAWGLWLTIQQKIRPSVYAGGLVVLAIVYGLMSGAPRRRGA
ncbi:hypothetical protein [Nitratireductor alexandrii]|uniref:hypothetical protein n=1 Tax=Nitratireductor alexandrii TaxID=2448161 RepID=UPI0013DEFC2D|nr:hypothetical protein [Nitratireductor alexandrii]